MLEHGNLIIGMSKDSDGGSGVWFSALDRAFEQTGTASYIRKTHGNAQNIVSGNVRAWRDVLRVCAATNTRMPTAVHCILEAYGVLFSDLLGNVFSAGDEEAWILHPGELTSGHEIRKHVCMTCWFTCDRGVSHELVRHRPASFCQESTRYCNYQRGDFGGEIAVIQPARQRRHRRQSVSGFICGWQAGGAGRRTVWSVHGADPAYKGNEACG